MESFEKIGYGMMGPILVTGATGLLGRHLVSQLRKEGRSVRVFVRHPSHAHVFPPGTSVALGDIRNVREVFEAVRDCDGVIHACSTHHYSLPSDDFFATNVTGTENVCSAVEAHGCRRLVVTSTISTLNGSAFVADDIRRLPPRKRMTLTKRQAEDLILSRVPNGLPAVVVNPAYFIGPWDEWPSPFRLWIPLAIRTPVRFVPSGGFSVLGAADVARFHLWALDHGKIGARYPVAGENISLRDYVAMVNSAAGHPCLPRMISPRAISLLKKTGLIDEYTAMLITRQSYFPAAADSRNTPLSSVIEETVRWFKETGKLRTLRQIARLIWARYL